jgi:isoleucyl-tRNA synthetase
LERLPYANKSRIDNKLEKEFEILRNVITDVLALRDKMRRDLRWPIKKIAIISNKTLVLRNNLDLLKKQTNVTDISLMKDIDGIRYETEIDYRSVGKKYGKLTSKIAKKIKSVPISELVSGYKTKIGGSYISLTKSDIKINAVLPEGAFGTANNDYLIILDKSEEGDMLISGFTRELIRKVQDHRKNIKLKKSEKINLKIASEVELNLNELQRKVNAKTIEIVNSLKKSEKMIIRGKKIEFSF